jgi:hypothetical protein
LFFLLPAKSCTDPVEVCTASQLRCQGYTGRSSAWSPTASATNDVDLRIFHQSEHNDLAGISAVRFDTCLTFRLPEIVRCPGSQDERLRLQLLAVLYSKSLFCAGIRVKQLMNCEETPTLEQCNILYTTPGEYRFSIGNSLVNKWHIRHGVLK